MMRCFQQISAVSPPLLVPRHGHCNEDYCIYTRSFEGGGYCNERSRTLAYCNDNHPDLQGRKGRGDKFMLVTNDKYPDNVKVRRHLDWYAQRYGVLLHA